jgi:hypothetical protein
MIKNSHHISIFLSARQTFDNIVRELIYSQEIHDFPEFRQYLESVAYLHHQVRVDCQEILMEYETFHRKLSEVTREKGEIVCSRHPGQLKKLTESQKKLERYCLMKDEGATPEAIYKAAKLDGMESYIELLALLRKVFDFSLKQAKDMVEAIEQS